MEAIEESNPESSKVKQLIAFRQNDSRETALWRARSRRTWLSVPTNVDIKFWNSVNAAKV